MKLEHIELSRLVISPVNMRAKHKGRDIAELIPSVRARGILVPLLVRSNGEPDVFEIVAGRRRYLAAAAVAAADERTFEVPCAIMEPGDDAAALEASLIENVARLDADEVSQWETFARLIREGRTVEDIAATFGLGDTVVSRILALGNLLPRIRTLYRAEQIKAATVRQLTMATIAQQREWLALYDSTDAYAPTGYLLKDWLFGGATISTSAALFDEAEYTAPIIADLFEDQRYFSDSTTFWNLQNKAVEERQRAYQAEGWSEIVVLQPGNRFESWEYQKRPRSKGGRVYIAISQGGAVEFHEGYVSRKEAERSEATSRPDAPVERSELTSPLRRYMELHRHGVVRAYLVEHPAIALRTMLAHAICGSSLWSVRSERQRADKPETEQSLMNSRAQRRFDEHRRTVIERLGFPPNQPSIIDAGHHHSFSEIFATLASMSGGELMVLTALVMGESLEAGGEAVALLGEELKVEPSSLWEPDDAFYALLRDRRVLEAVLEDVASAEVAQANHDAAGKVLKAIIRDCLEGRNGRTKVSGWVPRWLQFPATTYFEMPAEEPATKTSAPEANGAQKDTTEPA